MKQHLDFHIINHIFEYADLFYRVTPEGKTVLNTNSENYKTIRRFFNNIHLVYDGNRLYFKHLMNNKIRICTETLPSGIIYKHIIIKKNFKHTKMENRPQTHYDPPVDKLITYVDRAVMLKYTSVMKTPELNPKLSEYHTVEKKWEEVDCEDLLIYISDADDNSWEIPGDLHGTERYTNNVHVFMPSGQSVKFVEYSSENHYRTPQIQHNEDEEEYSVPLPN